MRRKTRAALAVVFSVGLVTAACSSSDTGSGSGSDVAPLTGEAGDGGVDLGRRALAFKVDDTGSGRPQAGIQNSDLIYEEVVEGGLTRLMAVFQSKNADSVGPIRSVRPVDPELVKGLGDAALVFSGGSEAVLDMVSDSGVTTVSDTSDSSAFERESGRPSPYNLFSSTDSVYGVLDDTSGAPPQLARFGDLPSDMQTSEATSVSVRLEDAATSEWEYDESSGVYARRVGGSPVKLVDGSDTQADNLVFQTVEMVDTGLTDATGAAVPDWKVTGQGELTVVRDGKAVTGTWQRSSDTDVAELTDASGNEIPLTPGSTWWTLVPSGTGDVQTS